MPERKERKESIASEVLGAIRKPQVTGDYVVDPETASAPLVGERTVIRACCLGCGHCLELLERGAKRLAQLAGVQEPDFWRDHYFEAQRCRICDVDYREVALKRIQDLMP